MLCQQCKERPASVHLSKIVNDHKSDMHLCEECARKSQLPWDWGAGEFSIHKFLAGLAGSDQVAGLTERTEGEKCHQCGLTYREFQHNGLLGCDQCYQSFSPGLSRVIRRIHGSLKHEGKVPRRAGGNLRLRKQLEKYKGELLLHIQREEFEEAAKLRDKIKVLEHQLNG